MSVCHRLTRLSQNIWAYSRILSTNYGSKMLHETQRWPSRSLDHVSKKSFSILANKQKTTFLNLFRLASSSPSMMDEGVFHTLVDETLDSLCAKLERYLEQVDDSDCDVLLSDGVLTVILGQRGTYVINKQTPNRQIWLSSPISGPKRYDYLDGRWIYRHDGKELDALLSTELEQLFNRKF